MSESTAKAQLDPEVGEGVSGYITPSDIQDAIGIIYDDFEAGDALRLSLGGGTLSGSLAGTSLSLSSTLAVTGNTTLTGDLTISKASASQTISSSAGQTSFNLDRIAGQYGIIQLRTGTSARWQMGIDSASESGSNAGSDFGLWAIDDNGSTTVTRALSITRSTGAVTLTGTLNGKVVNDLVTGPVSATDNALVRFDNTTGKVVQNSGITVDDSGNFTSDLTISKAAATVRLTSASGAAYLACNRVAGQMGGLRLETGGALRWLFAVNNASESGSNAGSDFVLGNYTDAGTSIGNVLSVQRSTGKFQIVNVGATAGLELGTSGPRVMSGTGSPEGVVSAPVNSVWYRTDATTLGDFVYTKMAGSSNTGWRVTKGDTGLRYIEGSLENGWTASGVGLRRIGNLCTMYVSAANATNATSDTFYTLPAGFRVGGTYAAGINIGLVVSSGVYKSISSVYSTGVTNIPSRGTSTYSSAAVTTWVTADTWPTSLPGITGTAPGS